MVCSFSFGYNHKSQSATLYVSAPPVRCTVIAPCAATCNAQISPPDEYSTCEPPGATADAPRKLVAAVAPLLARVTPMPPSKYNTSPVPSGTTVRAVPSTPSYFQ